MITQICYRAADFGFCLDMEGKRLSDYSEELRQETEYDAEAWQEEFKRGLKEKLGQEKDEGTA